MKRLIGLFAAAAAGTFGVAWLALASLPLAAVADAPVATPTPNCVVQTANPHPTAPVGPETDPLFCATASPSPSTSGNGSTAGSGSKAGGGSNGAGGSRGTGSTAVTAGYNPGTAAGTPTGASGASRNSAGNTGGSAKSGSSGFFGGLIAYLGGAGGLGWFLWFLLLLAIVLFVVAVMAWLTRRDGGSLGSRFSRIAHRP